MLQPQSWGTHLRTSGFETLGLQSLPPSVCQLLVTADKVQGTALEPYFAMGNLCISTEMWSYRRLLVTEVLVSSDFESPLILPNGWAALGWRAPCSSTAEAANSNIKKFTEQNFFIKNLPQAGEHDSLHVFLAV